MPRVARKPLIDEAPGLPARTPAQAQVRDRRLPREREAAERRAMGFPPGRTPDEAIAPSCRCSTSTAGCGCPAPRNPEDSILRGKELGVPTKPLWERVLTGAELGVPVKPWWERVVEMPGKPGPEPDPGPVPAFGRLLKTPTAREGPPGALPPGAPCGPLWEPLVATPPVDDSGMPAVTRPEQLDFGDIPQMGGWFERLSSGEGLWFVANASFVYRLRVSYPWGPDQPPGTVQTDGRWRIPRCFDGVWVPAVPQFTVVASVGRRYILIPAGNRAESGLIVGELASPTSQSIAWTHHPPATPEAFFRVARENGLIEPDLPANGVIKSVRIEANEDFIFVTRGAAGVAVFAHPWTPYGLASDWQFLGHLRMPIWGNEGWGDGAWGAEHLTASCLALHEVAVRSAALRLLVVGLSGANGPSSHYPRAAVYDVSDVSGTIAALTLDPLSPSRGPDGWSSQADVVNAGTLADTAILLKGVVALAPEAWMIEGCAANPENCWGLTAAMNQTEGIDVANLPGTLAWKDAGSGPSPERLVLGVANRRVAHVVDVTLIIKALESLELGHSSTATITQLVLPEPRILMWTELASFAVSSGACGSGASSVGPAARGFADAEFPNVAEIGNDNLTFCGRYMLTGWAATSAGNALHVLAMDYTTGLSTFTMRQVGEGRPSMVGPQTLESRSRFVYDPLSNTAFGSSRGRFGMVAMSLPPQSSAAAAVAAVGPNVFLNQAWYPSAGPLAACSNLSPTLRSPTGDYQLPTVRQSVPWNLYALAGQPPNQLPFNVTASVTAAGYMGPNAATQPWLDEGFTYEFVGGCTAADPDSDREVLFMADRMGAALWAFQADPVDALALDAFGWLGNAFDAVAGGEGHAHGTTLVVAAGATDAGLLFLSWDWNALRFVELGRLLPVTGNFDDGTGPGYQSRTALIRRLAGLGGPTPTEPTHVACTTNASGRLGPTFDTCHDNTDAFLVELAPVVNRMASAAGADHSDPAVSPDPFDLGWWNDSGAIPWTYRPWYQPANGGNSDPDSWTTVPGGPLPWVRFGLGRDRVLDSNGDAVFSTWLPDRNASVPGAGGWETGNAFFDDVAAHGDHVFVVVYMKDLPEELPDGFSAFWFLVLRKAPLTTLGENIPEDSPAAWCGVINNNGDIVRRGGALSTGPYTGDQILEWQSVGPPFAEGLEPVAAIPLGSTTGHDESSSIEVDPAGRYVSIVSGQDGFWLVHLGAPSDAGYAEYPVVAAGLRGDGASQQATGRGGDWWLWDPDEEELNRPVLEPATILTRGNDATFPTWPLAPAQGDLWISSGAIAQPPWRSSAFVRLEGGTGELLLFLNTAPHTVWVVDDLDDLPEDVSEDVAVTKANPLWFLGALCDQVRPALARDRVALVSQREVWFAGTGGAISIPLCGVRVPPSCCGTSAHSDQEDEE